MSTRVSKRTRTMIRSFIENTRAEGASIDDIATGLGLSTGAVIAAINVLAFDNTITYRGGRYRVRAARQVQDARDARSAVAAIVKSRYETFDRYETLIDIDIDAAHRALAGLGVFGKAITDAHRSIAAAIYDVASRPDVRRGSRVRIRIDAA